MPFTTPVTLEQSPDVALGNFPGRDLKVKYKGRYPGRLSLV